MSDKSTRLATRRGFTFIELVVVISIIVALAAIGFPTWGMISNRVKVNATDALVNSVATAITTYQTKTWTWNIGTTAAPEMRTYHIFDLNHFNPSSGSPIPDLPDIPNGSPRFWSIDGYTPPENGSYYDSSTSTFLSDVPPDPTPDPNGLYDGNFHRAVLNSGYRGFINMAQPQVKKSFINKRGQVVDAWGRPLRIAFAAKVYGTQAFGIWSAGLDKKDDLETRRSDDDLRSWRTQGAD
jgi:prepilin-type N-terminal cleavage/methylation domain-containing protein